MAASTKYVQKYTRKPQVHVKDEFFVQEKGILLVKQFKDKIENMHQIQISFEKQTEDGQWLILEGESEDRRNAKNYITAMCNPAERKQVQFPSAALDELTDPSTLELVEKKTNAFIRPLKKIAQFEISGTEFAVILALSEIEDLAGAVVREEEQFYDEVDSDEKDIITISPNTQNASFRLSSMLERALSANSDGVCSVDDYRHITPAVQRVLVNCLHADDPDDIDDELLFADGPTQTKMKDSKLKMFNEGDMGNVMKDTEYHKEKVEKISQEESDQISEATSLLTKQQEYLHSFGISVGFQEAEVNKALQFVDEKTRPSDFLDMLNSLQKQDEDSLHDNDSGDDVIILETETIELTGDKKTIDHESAKAESDIKMFGHVNAEALNEQTGLQNQGDKQNYPSTLPDGYMEMLLRDFKAEDESCSVEELKRRNAERQKMLRQKFESQLDSQSGQSNVPGQTGKKQNTKGKNRKKKNKQQKQNVDNQTNVPDLHEKQSRIDSVDNTHQTYSQDGEQTCVLKLWNKDQETRGNNQNEPFVTTPKRKQTKGNTQPHWHQQMPCNNKQRQNSPGRQTGGQWSPHQGAFGRGNFRKPTQVVTPVNAPHGGYRNMAGQDSKENNAAELRYIVIDGSNVAMTHGNGKFSCKGIKICVDHFRQRGHDKITVFVPQWRQYRPSDDNPILDQNILYELKDEEILVFTPSRKIGRKLVAAYDDRFVLELAEAEDGIIVSNDQYRDLMTEKAAWRKLIEERLLMYSFVRDRFMPPNDPLGREGPCLDEFLRVVKASPVNTRQRQGHTYQTQQQQKQQYQQHYPQAAGHGQFQQGHGQFQQSQGHGNVQYGQGQFHQVQGQLHAGHGHSQQNQGHFQQGHGIFAKAASQGLHESDNDNHLQKFGQGQKFKTSVTRSPNPHQLDETDGGSSPRNQVKRAVKGRCKGHGMLRTDEESEELFKELRTIFPEDDQEEKVRSILANHDRERDLTKLTNYLMSILF